MKLYWLALFFILVPMVSHSESLPPIDLSGAWEMRLDAEDGMISADPATWTFDDIISLPGTTDLARKGPRNNKPIPYHYHLNREFAHLGPAFYSRQIAIPESWRGRRGELVLERVMWQSRVWLDGKEVGTPRDSLNTPHIHSLGKLSPGKHRLIIRVDNRMIHPIGDKGHAYGAQTQSIWNGIVGTIEVRPVPDKHIGVVRVFPSNDGKVTVEVSGSAKGHIELKAGVVGVTMRQSLEANGSFTTTLRGKVVRPELWSEFNPKTYLLDVQLIANGQVIDSRQTSFGFREIRRAGNRLLINGKPAFMRGNLECAVFPKTGHPPVTVDAWKRIWQVYKAHNLNHARFHSWCPPKAAFEAADALGIYLQVEAPIWIDHWMTKPNPRKEMDTAGYPKGLGHNDRSIDQFALAEIRRTIDTYGNHPSFVFFAIGNELGTSNFDVTGTWMRDARDHDPRRLYAASTARTITPHCDFNATHNIPGIGWCRQKVLFGTNWDYEDKYGAAPVPIIAHEIGQWPVYVDWNHELPKYTGPLKPYRLQEMAEAARKNGLYDRSTELKAASGAANRILYRDEIESFLRTPSCRGFQLLSMQDFSGQGEALVGWLDSFYESKGTTDPGDFRGYCAPTVPLLKLPGYVFTSSESPEVEALLHHYGQHPLENVDATWELTDATGTRIDSGMLGKSSHATGTVSSLGTIRPDLSTVDAPTQATLTVGLPTLKLSNSYPLWIYPEAPAATPGASIIVATDWETEAKPALAAGKSVVLVASDLGGPKASKFAHWFPLYWSVPFFPGQNRETIGLRVSADHPAFAMFPTPAYGDWNWFRICKSARGFDLTEITPADFIPMAEPVTDFHHNRRLGSIFEAKVGPGHLLVCGYNINEEHAGKLPEVAQLRLSLLNYAASPDFHPTVAMANGDLDKLFHDPTLKQPELPARFAKADLYVDAAGKLRSLNRNVPWKKASDFVLRQAEGVDFAVKTDGSWRDNQGSAWHGNEITVTITPRAGVPGKLFVRFHDWNKNGRSGTVQLENKPPVKLGDHIQAQWLEFPVIREDTNDARLVLKTKALSGPNLMITDLAFVPED